MSIDATLGPYDRVTPSFFTDKEFTLRKAQELIKPLPGLYTSQKIAYQFSSIALSSRVTLAKLWLERISPTLMEKIYTHNLLRRPYRV
ncbi:MAG TPA: hypothetical protein VK158_06595 [Acidobacteriota bacterium]|nr:hypothetical protein [Acidobacteriota bacterium]